MTATEIRPTFAKSLVTLDLPIAQPLVPIAPKATAAEIRSACDAARSAVAKLNDAASFHGTNPTGFQRVVAKVSPWFNWGSAAIGTGVMIAIGGYDAAPLGAMLAGGAATGVTFFAPQIAEHFTARRSMSAKAVGGFTKGSTPFERALLASLAAHALTTLKERNVSSYESRMVLRGVIDAAAPIDPSVRASAERVASFIVLVPAGADAGKVSDEAALELGIAFEALQGEERAAVKALVRETLLAGKAPLDLGHTGWTLLHDVVKPQVTLPMLPAPADAPPVAAHALVVAQSRALVTPSNTYRQAIAAAREADWALRSLPRRGQKTSDSGGEFASVMSGFFGVGGAVAAGVATASFFLTATTAVFAVRAAVGLYNTLTDPELVAQLRGPTVKLLAKAQAQLDTADPIERAIAAELARQQLAKLEKDDVRGIELHEHLETIASADVSPANRASAERMVAVMTADMAMRSTVIDDGKLAKLTAALRALTDSERRTVEPELFEHWVKRGKPRDVAIDAWQAFERALSGEAKC